MKKILGGLVAVGMMFYLFNSYLDNNRYEVVKTITHKEFDIYSLKHYSVIDGYDVLDKRTGEISYRKR